MSWISLLHVTILALVASVSGLASPPPKRLQELLQSEIDGTRENEMPILLPCCYDGLTARLVSRAGFEATFMTGFGVSGMSWLTSDFFIEIKANLPYFDPTPSCKRLS